MRGESKDRLNKRKNEREIVIIIVFKRFLVVFQIKSAYSRGSCRRNWFIGNDRAPTL
jgi:hypothetical protein